MSVSTIKMFVRILKIIALFNERDEQSSSCHVNLPRDLNKLKAFTANRLFLFLRH